MEARVSEPARKSQTILIVDDEPSIRLLFRSALQALPARILEADNGLEAMSLIEQEKPDLVVTDYAMPDWDGLEVCHPAAHQDRADHGPGHAALLAGSREFRGRERGTRQAGQHQRTPAAGQAPPGPRSRIARGWAGAKEDGYGDEDGMVPGLGAARVGKCRL